MGLGNSLIFEPEPKSPELLTTGLKSNTFLRLTTEPSDFVKLGIFSYVTWPVYEFTAKKSPPAPCSKYLYLIYTEEGAELPAIRFILPRS